MKHGVYRLTLDSTVVYVGRSYRPRTRMLAARIRYQLPDLEMGEIEWFDDFGDAQKRELALIDELTPRLNKRRISSPGALGKKFSEEARQRLRDARRAIISTPGFRERMSIARSGIPHSAEAKAKMSASQKRRAPATPETRARISAALSGKTHSPEHRAANSAAKKAAYAARSGRAL